MKNTLRIKDRTFEIQYAKLDCFAGRYAGGTESVLKWGFNLRGISEHPDYADWSPVLTSEILFTTSSGELSSWLDVAPREVTWSTPITPANDPYASLYVFGHEPTVDGRVVFSRDPEGLRMHLRAKCAVYWGEYSDRLELEVETLFTKLVFLAGRVTEGQAREELRPFLDDSAFRYGQNQYGASTLTLELGRGEGRVAN